MRENKYQAHVIERLREDFFGCIILKNDSAYLQGVPDLTVLYGKCWATLEVKASEDAPSRPNQPYYVALMDAHSFSAFIYPSNEEEVFRALQRAFARAFY